MPIFITYISSNLSANSVRTTHLCDEPEYKDNPECDPNVTPPVFSIEPEPVLENEEIVDEMIHQNHQNQMMRAQMKEEQKKRTRMQMK
jgi:hypothetical protein